MRPLRCLTPRATVVKLSKRCDRRGLKCLVSIKKYSNTKIAKYHIIIKFILFIFFSFAPTNLWQTAYMLLLFIYFLCDLIGGAQRRIIWCTCDWLWRETLHRSTDISPINLFDNKKSSSGIDRIAFTKVTIRWMYRYVFFF